MSNSDSPRNGGEPLERRSKEARDQERQEQADAIIKAHMNLAMMSGAIPIPLLDLTALTAVQLDQLRQLSQLYDVPFNSRAARSFLTSLGSALAGRWLARAGAASLAKLVPFVGFLAGGLASSMLNGAFTYAVGTVMARQFAQGKPIESLKVADIKGELAHLIESGRQQASAMMDKLRDKGGRK